MSDSAEFEKITALEARLAVALDRIAAALPAGPVVSVQTDDPGLTSSALEDAQARADTAEDTAAQWAERARSLEGELEALRAALAEARAAAEGAGQDTARPADLAPELDGVIAERDALLLRIEGLEAARQADQDEGARAMAAKNAEIASLEEKLAKASAPPAPGVGSSDGDASSGEDADTDTDGDGTSGFDADEQQALQMRLRRLKKQRAMARSQRDGALATIEEMEREPGNIDARVIELRRDLAALRVTNTDLVDQLSKLNETAIKDLPNTEIVEGLVTQINALEAAREAEAAELSRILSDLEPLETEETAHA